MKRSIALLLALILVFSLTACGKTENAKNADALIAAIGTVTLDSESAIQEAEKACAALTQEEKDSLDNYETLTAARATLDDLLAQKKAEEEAAAEALRIEQVKAVAADMDAAISSIGTVTLESEETIVAARACYDALDEETKGYVTKLADLEKAEADLNQAKAEEVIALIAAIGNVTADSGDAITAASDKYEALPEAAQGLVENAAVLSDAVTAYDELMQKKVDGILARLQLDHDEVRGIKFYYASNFPYYPSYGYWGADIRCFVLPYLGIQGDNVWLRMVCDYTSGDWVFFEKITFAVDDARYYKHFSYYDVTRDNAWGDIWEYVDIPVEDTELEILEAIANSEKTIVRFEGDNYYDDFVVTEKDKAAIKEMLMVYEYLLNK